MASAARFFPQAIPDEFIFQAGNDHRSDTVTDRIRQRPRMDIKTMG
jgi:hypothetical protein